MSSSNSNNIKKTFNPNSPYDTESEIKLIKSFPITIIFGFLFIDQDMMGNTTDLSIQDQLMEEEIDSDLQSMSDDEVKPVSRFEAVESTDEENDKAETKALPKFGQRVQETLKAHVPKRISKPLNTELNALNTLECRRFDTLQMELMTAIQAKAMHLCELINLIKDMVFLLESAKVFEKVKAEGEKASLEEDMALELAKETKAAKEAKDAEEAKANA
ncbi:hypothetical protein Tco_0301154 [Tanacetum coccineum]